MKKIIGIISICLMLVSTSVISTSSEKEVLEDEHSESFHKAFYAHIHLELDPSLDQAKVIKEHSLSFPDWSLLFLQKITLENPNINNESMLIIIPVYRAMISHRCGIGVIQEFIPQENTVIYLNLFWGMIEERDSPDGKILVVDGFAPCLVWSSEEGSW